MLIFSVSILRQTNGSLTKYYYKISAKGRTCANIRFSLSQHEFGIRSISRVDGCRDFSPFQ